MCTIPSCQHIFLVLCNAIFLICFFFLTGFAFIYFEDERDAEDAIRALDGAPFGEGRRRLSVEWSKVLGVRL